MYILITCCIIVVLLLIASSIRTALCLEEFDTHEMNWCILLTTCVMPFYSATAKTKEELIRTYLRTIEYYLNTTTMPIVVVESSGFHFQEYTNNSRVTQVSIDLTKLPSSVQGGPTRHEATSVIECYKRGVLSKYNYVLKITGKYCIKNLQSIVNSLPPSFTIYCQQFNVYESTRINTEVFGFRTKNTRRIFKKMTKQSTNFDIERQIYIISTQYTTYMLPKMELEFKPLPRYDRSTLHNL